MTYLLDTNACIAIINGRPQSVREQFAAALADGAAISVSSIVAFELWYGVAKSEHHARNADRLRTFLRAPMEILVFDDEDAQRAGVERAHLEAAGKPIGAYDLLIAAQALRRQQTLVTANIGEFSRVHGLIWQDWAATSAH